MHPGLRWYEGFESRLLTIVIFSVIIIRRGERFPAKSTIRRGGMGVQRVKDMTGGRPLKLIVTFALPLMLGNMGQQLYMVVDGIVVGQGVGVDALAALGATDWTCWMLLWMAQGFAQGFSVLAAQRFGAGDLQGLRRGVAMSVVLGLGLSVVLTALGLGLARPLLTLLGTPEDIFPGAMEYITTMFWGMTVVFAYNLAGGILRALGDGKTPLYAMAVAAGTNIALDLLFVMVFHWGIVGAAVATVLAQGVSFLYCLLVMRRMPALGLKKADFALDWPLLGRLWRLGLPVALQNAFIAVGGMVVQSVLNGLGFLYIAGFTATNKIYGLMESAAIAFGYSMTTYMGQNLGAGRHDRIREGMRCMVKLSLVVAVGTGILVSLAGRPILSLFVSSTEANAGQVVDIAFQYLFIMCCNLIVLYLLHAYRSALQGLGNTTAAMVSGVMEFICRVGTALILPRLMGDFGIFFAEPMAWLGAAVFLFFAYYKEARSLRERAVGGISGQA